MWGGALIQTLHSGLVFNAFSLIAAQLHTEFGWSNSTLGGAFALNRAESGLLGPVQGWMTDRWGAKTVLRVGAAIMAIGLVLFATLDSIAEFYIYYLLVALGSSLAGFLPITVTVVHWFERKRSRALAYAQMGFAVGGTLAFAFGILLDQVGWRKASLFSALLTLVVIVPTAGLFHNGQPMSASSSTASTPTTSPTTHHRCRPPRRWSTSRPRRRCAPEPSGSSRWATRRRCWWSARRWRTSRCI